MDAMDAVKMESMAEKRQGCDASCGMSLYLHDIRNNDKASMG